MGCISSKHAKSASSPVHHESDVISIRDVVNVPSSRNVDSSSSVISNSSSNSSNSSSKLYVNNRSGGGFGPLEKIKEEPEKEKEKDDGEESDAAGVCRKHKSGNSKPSKRAAFSIKFGRMVEGEHVAAGWPAWLSVVAGEAIDGWLPLRSDSFERLEKIGQGTYSSVYRARDLETGRMMALKKVRFDNFQPESVRFMAREITILRRLDHPNIMKLEGLITSRLSCSIYFVFEYMEHDLSGLLSCPDIKFTDSQIKCYMKQLLRGVEHCHSRGVLHRDIKTSNILVNNEGQLKIGDFGLANFLSSKNRQPLTSRVVTLWYRPPELLLGSTNYGPTADLWSVGCVFAELFIGRPILKGRTEVEQLHKIFKLCGSPPDEYWKKSKLPLANMFKPQQAYESVLRERCKELPKSAVNLIETFLSIEPYRRGTAASALDSEYFTTKPYACEPSSLPKYPPNKEIDAKFREEARRRKAGGNIRATGASRIPRRVRKTSQEPSSFCKVVPTEAEGNMQVVRRGNGGNGNTHLLKVKGATVSRGYTKASYDTVSEASQASEATEASQADSIRTVPVQSTASSGLAWAKRRKHDASHSRSRQNGNAFDPVSVQDLGSPELENEAFAGRNCNASRGRDEHWRSMQWQQSFNRPDSYDSSDIDEAQEVSEDYHKQQERIPLSGPLPSQPHELDGRQESHTHQIRRSRFHRDV